MPNILTGTIWKIGVGLAAVLCIALTVMLASSYIENRYLTDQREILSKQINDPRTGFVVRLAQANTNVETLKVALDTQRKSFETKAAERERVLVNTTAQLTVAQRASRAMQLKLDRFLATKPQGATLEDRVRDIDQRAMTELVE